MTLEELSAEELVELLRECVALNLISETTLMRTALYKRKIKVVQEVQKIKDDIQMFKDFEDSILDKGEDNTYVDWSLARTYQCARIMAQNKLSGLNEKLKEIDSWLGECV